MVYVPVPESVGAVVEVAPWYVLLVFSGVCVTAPTIAMFNVSPACSFCVPYKVNISSSNDSVILYNLIRSRSFARQGLGSVWGGSVVGWGKMFFLVWFTVALRNVLLKCIWLSMCFSRLGLQIVVVTGWFHNLLFWLVLNLFLLVFPTLFLRLFFRIRST